MVDKIIERSERVSYWAAEIEIVTCLASFDWRMIQYLDVENKKSEIKAFQFYLKCLQSKDTRIRDGALGCTLQFATRLHGPRYIHKVWNLKEQNNYNLRGF